MKLINLIILIPTLIFGQAWYYSHVEVSASQVAFVSNHDNSTTAGTSLTVSGVTGGSGNLYIASWFWSGNPSITSHVGGGLTWTQRSTTTGAAGEAAVYTATGTPSGNPFTVTLTLSSSVIIIGRISIYNGHDGAGTPVEDFTSATGTNDSPTLTISSTNRDAGDMYFNHLGFVDTDDDGQDLVTPDANWTNRGGIEDVSSGFLFTLDEDGTDNVPSHALDNGNIDWHMHGLLINAAP